ncbi:hypothetical protein ALC60_08732, partial [Trachymyrmex zeteki]
ARCMTNYRAKSFRKYRDAVSDSTDSYSVRSPLVDFLLFVTVCRCLSLCDVIYRDKIFGAILVRMHLQPVCNSRFGTFVPLSHILFIISFAALQTNNILESRFFGVQHWFAFEVAVQEPAKRSWPSWKVVVLSVGGSSQEASGSGLRDDGGSGSVCGSGSDGWEERNVLVRGHERAPAQDRSWSKTKSPTGIEVTAAQAPGYVTRRARLWLPWLRANAAMHESWPRSHEPHRVSRFTQL